MNILMPINIVDSMIVAGTNIPVVDASVGEVAWVASGSFVVGDLRVYAGGVYSCVKAHTATLTNKPPSEDKINWLFKEPTNRMAPFDEYVYTAAKKAGEIKYVLTPGFFTGWAMYGAEADVIDVIFRDHSGGEILKTRTQEMWEQAFGEWEYLFGNLQRTTKITQSDWPLRPAGELEIVLKRNNPEVIAELGYLAVGQWQKMLLPKSSMGGTEYGAEVTPKSYGYMRYNPEDGTYTRRKGRVAKLITASVVIDADEAPRVERLLEKIIDIPVAIEADSLPRYGHISTVGFVTGSVRSEGWGYSRVNIKVEGNV